MVAVGFRGAFVALNVLLWFLLSTLTLSSARDEKRWAVSWAPSLSDRRSERLFLRETNSANSLPATQQCELRLLEFCFDVDDSHVGALPREVTPRELTLGRRRIQRKVERHCRETASDYPSVSSRFTAMASRRQPHRAAPVATVEGSNEIMT